MKDSLRYLPAAATFIDATLQAGQLHAGNTTTLNITLTPDVMTP